MRPDHNRNASPYNQKRIAKAAAPPTGPGLEEIKEQAAVKNLGIIAQRVLRHWRRLPPSVKVFYDVDDMIGEVVLHVYRVRSHINLERGRDSTWTWHVADNKCKSILSHYRSRQFSACETVELESTVPHSTTRLIDGLATPSTLDRREARNAVERVIEAGSDAVRDLLEQLFNCEPDEGLDVRGSLNLIEDSDAAAELRHLAACCGARLRDFILVYRYAQQ